MDDLYREHILEHYKRPQNFGSLPEPDLEFRDSNPLCGDEYRVQLKLDDTGRIADLRFDGQGCAISKAACSARTSSTRTARAPPSCCGRACRAA